MEKVLRGFLHVLATGGTLAEDDAWRMHGSLRNPCNQFQQPHARSAARGCTSFALTRSFRFMLLPLYFFFSSQFCLPDLTLALVVVLPASSLTPAAPSPSLMPVPSSGPTPVPSPIASGCPAYPAFPDSNCTGWKHTGVTLTAVPSQASRGPGWHVETVAGQPIFYVTQDNTIVDGLDISVCVKVFANNVTIQRSRIRCSDYYAIRMSDPPTRYQGLNLIDVELDGLGQIGAQTIAVEESANDHFLRVDVHGMGSSGPRIGSATTIEDSYIHDFTCNPGDHTAGISANGGGSNIIVRHNNIDTDQRLGCATASWEIALDFGTYNGILTEKNLFNGGSYCAYAALRVPGSVYPPAINVRFIDNVFGRKYSPKCGGHGPIAQWADSPGSVWSNNTWGPGAMATSNHNVGDPVAPY
jgi:hypothetical protein